MSAIVQYNPQYGEVQKLFAGLAPELLKSTGTAGITKQLEYVPAGVVADVYPLAGNNAGAVGFNLFNSDDREGALHTVGQGNLTLVGPMEFFEGGFGVIVRDPIIIRNADPNATYGLNANPYCGAACAYDPATRTKFWGFSAGLIDLDVLNAAEESKLRSLAAMGYRYEVRALGIASASLRLVASSPKAPERPEESIIHLPNSEWVVRVSPDDGWSSDTYPGLLAGVIVAGFVLAVMVFFVLVSRKKHQLLLEALLPKALLRDLNNNDPTLLGPRIIQTETTADLILTVLSQLLEGVLPDVRDVVFARQAILRTHDIYQPMHLGQQIKEANLDGDVASNLIQQLLGQYNRMSFASLSSKTVLASRILDEDGSGPGEPEADEKGGLADSRTSPQPKGGPDCSTLASALAVILTPSPAWDGETEPVTFNALPSQLIPVSALPCKLPSGTLTLPNGGAEGKPLDVVIDVGGQNPPRPGSLHALHAQVNSAVREGGDLTSFGSTGATPQPGMLARAVSFLRETAAVAFRGDSATQPGLNSPVSLSNGARRISLELTHPAMPASSTIGTGSILLGLRSPAGSRAASRRVSLNYPMAGLDGSSPHPQMQPTMAQLCIMPPLHASAGIPGMDPMREAGAAESRHHSSRALAPPPPDGGFEQPDPELVFSTTDAMRTSPRQHGAPRRVATGLGMTAQQQLNAAAAGTASLGPPVGFGGGRALRARSQLSESSSPAAAGGVRVLTTTTSSRPRSGLHSTCRLERPCTGGPVVVADATCPAPDGVGSFSVPVDVEAGQGSVILSGGVTGTLTSAGASSGAGQRLLLSSVSRRGAASTLGGAGGSPAANLRKTPSANHQHTHSGSAVAAAVLARAQAIPPAPSVIEEVERLLSGVDQWKFDAWQLREATDNHPLSALGFYLFQRSGLIEHFRIQPAMMARLLRHIEAGYVDNPYHNATHAADVLQTLHVIIHGAQLHVHYLDPLGLLAAYWAAIVHDYGHPGLTNDFLINTADPLAVRYNDRSPLENHHAAASSSAMRRPELDITAFLPKPQRAAFRKQVIDMVLATDMKQHFSLLSQFNTVHRLAQYSAAAYDTSPPPSSSRAAAAALNGPRAASQSEVAITQIDDPVVQALAPQPVDENEKLLSLQLAMKAADLGHLGEQLEVHKRWLAGLEEEFFRQGDKEKALGLPISPLFDRAKQGVSKSQVGFYDFVALPLVHALVGAFPAAEPLMCTFVSNYNHWRVVDGQEPVAMPSPLRKENSNAAAMAAIKRTSP
ncbi:hypothetical protein HYH03_016058 [Edaphochlamys debaryana]|uniref:Phosphodiesterase n=1 Tax=Edaphochlamys debaryana TaxID=47281 RepID=A0A835XLU5_9CHLO|nr:hypothetical protein HYH03_016058 [Edaphochlamys debaryana]|eukprot:KAG2485168.1 hypothetical protein HYH03_016058 [Edaphochlamys debaryana]